MRHTVMENELLLFYQVFCYPSYVNQAAEGTHQ